MATEAAGKHKRKEAEAPVGALGEMVPAIRGAQQGSVDKAEAEIARAQEAAKAVEAEGEKAAGDAQKEIEALESQDAKRAVEFFSAAIAQHRDNGVQLKEPKLDEAAGLMEGKLGEYAEGKTKEEKDAALDALYRLDMYCRTLEDAKSADGIPGDLKDLGALAKVRGPAIVLEHTVETSNLLLGAQFEGRLLGLRKLAGRVEQKSGVLGEAASKTRELLENAQKTKEDAIAQEDIKKANELLGNARDMLAQAEVVLNFSLKLEAANNALGDAAPESQKRYEPYVSMMEQVVKDSLAPDFDAEKAEEAGARMASAIKQFSLEGKRENIEMMHEAVSSEKPENRKLAGVWEGFVSISQNAIRRAGESGLTVEEREKLLLQAREALAGASLMGSIPKTYRIAKDSELEKFIKGFEAEGKGALAVRDAKGRPIALSKEGAAQLERADSEIQLSALQESWGNIRESAANMRSRFAANSEVMRNISAADRAIIRLRGDYEKTKDAQKRQEIAGRISDISFTAQQYLGAVSASRKMRMRAGEPAEVEARKREAGEKIAALGNYVQEVSSGGVKEGKEKEVLFSRVIPEAVKFVADVQTRENIERFRKDAGSWGKEARSQMEKWAGLAEKFTNMGDYTSAARTLEQGVRYRSTMEMRGIRGKVPIAREEAGKKEPGAEAGPAPAGEKKPGAGEEAGVTGYARFELTPVPAAEKEAGAGEKEEPGWEAPLLARTVPDYEKEVGRRGVKHNQMAHVRARREFIAARDAAIEALSAMEAGNMQAAQEKSAQSQKANMRAARRMGSARASWAALGNAARSADSTISWVEQGFIPQYAGEEREKGAGPQKEGSGKKSSRKNSNELLGQMQAAAAKGDAREVGKLSAQMRRAINQDIGVEVVAPRVRNYLDAKRARIEALKAQAGELEAGAGNISGMLEEDGAFREGAVYHDRERTERARSGMSTVSSNSRYAAGELREEAGKREGEIERFVQKWDKKTSGEDPDWVGFVTPGEEEWINEDGSVEVVPSAGALNEDIGRMEGTFAEMERGRVVRNANAQQQLSSFTLETAGAVPSIEPGSQYSQQFSRFGLVGLSLMGEASTLAKQGKFTESARTVTEASSGIAMGAGISLKTETGEKVKKELLVQSEKEREGMRAQGRAMGLSPQKIEEWIKSDERAKRELAKEIDPENLTWLAEAAANSYSVNVLGKAAVAKGDVTKGTFEVKFVPLGLGEEEKAERKKQGLVVLGAQEEEGRIASANNYHQIASGVLGAAGLGRGFWKNSVVGTQLEAEFLLGKAKAAVAFRRIENQDKEALISFAESEAEFQKSVETAAYCEALSDFALVMLPGGVAGVMTRSLRFGLDAERFYTVLNSMKNVRNFMNVARLGMNAERAFSAAEALREIGHAKILSDMIGGALEETRMTGAPSWHSVALIAHMSTAGKFSKLYEAMSRVVNPQVMGKIQLFDKIYSLAGGVLIAGHGTYVFSEAVEQAEREGRGLTRLEYFGLFSSWLPMVQGPLTMAEGATVGRKYGALGKRFGLGLHRYEALAEAEAAEMAAAAASAPAAARAAALGPLEQARDTVEARIALLEAQIRRAEGGEGGTAALAEGAKAERGVLLRRLEVLNSTIEGAIKRAERGGRRAPPPMEELRGTKDTLEGEIAELERKAGAKEGLEGGRAEALMGEIGLRREKLEAVNAEIARREEREAPGGMERAAAPGEAAARAGGAREIKEEGFETEFGVDAQEAKKALGLLEGRGEKAEAAGAEREVEIRKGMADRALTEKEVVSYLEETSRGDGVEEIPTYSPVAKPSSGLGNRVIGGKELTAAIEHTIRNRVEAGEEFDVVVISGDKVLMNDANPLLQSYGGDVALDAYRMYMREVIGEALGGMEGAETYAYRPFMRGDEYYGIVVVKKGMGETFVSRVRDAKLRGRVQERVLERVSKDTRNFPQADQLPSLFGDKGAFVSGTMDMRIERVYGPEDAEKFSISESITRAEDPENIAGNISSSVGVAGTSEPIMASEKISGKETGLALDLGIMPKWKPNSESMLQVLELIEAHEKGYREKAVKEERIVGGKRLNNLLYGHPGNNTVATITDSAIAVFAAEKGIGIRRTSDFGYKYIVELPGGANLSTAERATLGEAISEEISLALENPLEYLGAKRGAMESRAESLGKNTAEGRKAEVLARRLETARGELGKAYEGREGTSLNLEPVVDIAKEEVSGAGPREINAKIGEMRLAAALETIPMEGAARENVVSYLRTENSSRTIDSVISIIRSGNRELAERMMGMEKERGPELHAILDEIFTGKDRKMVRDAEDLAYYIRDYYAARGTPERAGIFIERLVDYCRAHESHILMDWSVVETVALLRAVSGNGNYDWVRAEYAEVAASADAPLEAAGAGEGRYTEAERRVMGYGREARAGYEEGRAEAAAWKLAVEFATGEGGRRLREQAASDLAVLDTLNREELIPGGKLWAAALDAEVDTSARGAVPAPVSWIGAGPALNTKTARKYASRYGEAAGRAEYGAEQLFMSKAEPLPAVSGTVEGAGEVIGIGEFRRRAGELDSRVEKTAASIKNRRDRARFLQAWREVSDRMMHRAETAGRETGNLSLAAEYETSLNLLENLEGIAGRVAEKGRVDLSVRLFEKYSGMVEMEAAAGRGSAGLADAYGERYQDAVNIAIENAKRPGEGRGGVESTREIPAERRRAEDINAFREQLAENESAVEIIRGGMDEAEGKEFLAGWERVFERAMEQAENEAERLGNTPEALTSAYQTSLNVLDMVLQRAAAVRIGGPGRAVAFMQAYAAMSGEAIMEATLLAGRRGGPTTGKLTIIPVGKSQAGELAVGHCKYGIMLRAGASATLKDIVHSLERVPGAGAGSNVLSEELGMSAGRLISLLDSGREGEVIGHLNRLLMYRGVVLSSVDGVLTASRVSEVITRGRARLAVVEPVEGLADPMVISAPAAKEVSDGRGKKKVRALFERGSMTLLLRRGDVEAEDVGHELAHYEQAMSGFWERAPSRDLESVARAVESGFSTLKAEDMLLPLIKDSAGEGVYAEAAGDILNWKGDGGLSLNDMAGEAGIKKGDSKETARVKLEAWAAAKSPGQKADIDLAVRLRHRQFADAQYEAKLGISRSELFAPLGMVEGAGLGNLWRVRGVEREEFVPAGEAVERAGAGAPRGAAGAEGEIAGIEERLGKLYGEMREVLGRNYRASGNAEAAAVTYELNYGTRLAEIKNLEARLQQIRGEGAAPPVPAPAMKKAPPPVPGRPAMRRAVRVRETAGAEAERRVGELGGRIEEVAREYWQLRERVDRAPPGVDARELKLQEEYAGLVNEMLLLQGQMPTGQETLAMSPAQMRMLGDRAKIIENSLRSAEEELGRIDARRDALMEPEKHGIALGGVEEVRARLHNARAIVQKEINELSAALRDTRRLMEEPIPLELKPVGAKETAGEAKIMDPLHELELRQSEEEELLSTPPDPATGRMKPEVAKELAEVRERMLELEEQLRQETSVEGWLVPEAEAVPVEETPVETAGARERVLSLYETRGHILESIASERAAGRDAGALLPGLEAVESDIQGIVKNEMTAAEEIGLEGELGTKRARISGFVQARSSGEIIGELEMARGEGRKQDASVLEAGLARRYRLLHTQFARMTRILKVSEEAPQQAREAMETISREEKRLAGLRADGKEAEAAEAQRRIDIASKRLGKINSMVGRAKEEFASLDEKVRARAGTHEGLREELDRINQEILLIEPEIAGTGPRAPPAKRESSKDIREKIANARKEHERHAADVQRRIGKLREEIKEGPGKALAKAALAGQEIKKLEGQRKEALKKRDRGSYGKLGKEIGRLRRTQKELKASAGRKRRKANAAALKAEIGELEAGLREYTASKEREMKFLKRKLAYASIESGEPAGEYGRYVRAARADIKKRTGEAELAEIAVLAVDKGARDAALSGIKDQRLLAEIAIESRYYDTRINAVLAVRDPTVLKEIIKTAESDQDLRPVVQAGVEAFGRSVADFGEDSWVLSIVANKSASMQHRKNAIGLMKDVEALLDVAELSEHNDTSLLAIRKALKLGVDSVPEERLYWVAHNSLPAPGSSDLGKIQTARAILLNFEKRVGTLEHQGALGLVASATTSQEVLKSAIDRITDRRELEAISTASPYKPNRLSAFMKLAQIARADKAAPLNRFEAIFAGSPDAEVRNAIPGLIGEIRGDGERIEFEKRVGLRPPAAGAAERRVEERAGVQPAAPRRGEMVLDVEPSAGVEPPPPPRAVRPGERPGLRLVRAPPPKAAGRRTPPAIARPPPIPEEARAGRPRERPTQPVATEIAIPLVARKYVPSEMGEVPSWRLLELAKYSEGILYRGEPHPEGLSAAEESALYYMLGSRKAEDISPEAENELWEIAHRIVFEGASYPKGLAPEELGLIYNMVGTEARGSNAQVGFGLVSEQRAAELAEIAKKIVYKDMKYPSGLSKDEQAALSYLVGAEKKYYEMRGEIPKEIAYEEREYPAHLREEEQAALGYEVAAEKPVTMDGGVHAPALEEGPAGGDIIAYPESNLVSEPLAIKLAGIADRMVFEGAEEPAGLSLQEQGALYYLVGIVKANREIYPDVRIPPERLIKSRNSAARKIISPEPAEERTAGSEPPPPEASLWKFLKERYKRRRAEAAQPAGAAEVEKATVPAPTQKPALVPGEAAPARAQPPPVPARARAQPREVPASARVSPARLRLLARFANRIAYGRAEEPDNLGFREKRILELFIKEAKKRRAAREPMRTPSEAAKSVEDRLALKEFENAEEKRKYLDSIKERKMYDGQMVEYWTEVKSASGIGDGHGNMGAVAELLERSGVVTPKKELRYAARLVEDGGKGENHFEKLMDFVGRGKSLSRFKRLKRLARKAGRRVRKRRKETPHEGFMRFINEEYSGKTTAEKFMKFLDEHYDVNLEEGQHVVFMGDYFDRGATSMELFTFARWLQRKAAEKGAHVHMLRGNHEEIIRSVYEQYAGADTATMNRLISEIDAYNAEVNSEEAREYAAGLLRDNNIGVNPTTVHSVASMAVMESGRYPLLKEIQDSRDINISHAGVGATLKNMREWYGEGAEDSSWWEKARAGMKADGTLGTLSSLKAMVVLDNNVYMHGGPNVNFASLAETNQYFTELFSTTANHWATTSPGGGPAGDYSIQYHGLQWFSDSPGVPQWRSAFAANLGLGAPLQINIGHSKQGKGITSDPVLGVTNYDTNITSGKGEMVTANVNGSVLTRGAKRQALTGSASEPFTGGHPGIMGSERAYAESVPVKSTPVAVSRPPVPGPSKKRAAAPSGKAPVSAAVQDGEPRRAGRRGTRRMRTEPLLMIDDATRAALARVSEDPAFNAELEGRTAGELRQVAKEATTAAASLIEKAEETGKMKEAVPQIAELYAKAEIARGRAGALDARAAALSDTWASGTAERAGGAAAEPGGRTTPGEGVAQVKTAGEAGEPPLQKTKSEEASDDVQVARIADDLSVDAEFMKTLEGKSPEELRGMAEALEKPTDAIEDRWVFASEEKRTALESLAEAQVMRNEADLIDGSYYMLAEPKPAEEGRRPITREMHVIKSPDVQVREILSEARTMGKTLTPLDINNVRILTGHLSVPGKMSMAARRVSVVCDRSGQIVAYGKKGRNHPADYTTVILEIDLPSGKIKNVIGWAQGRMKLLEGIKIRESIEEQEKEEVRRGRSPRTMAEMGEAIEQGLREERKWRGAAKRREEVPEWIARSDRKWEERYGRLIEEAISGEETAAMGADEKALKLSEYKETMDEFYADVYSRARELGLTDAETMELVSRWESTFERMLRMSASGPGFAGEAEAPAPLVRMGNLLNVMSRFTSELMGPGIRSGEQLLIHEAAVSPGVVRSLKLTSLEPGRPVEVEFNKELAGKLERTLEEGRGKDVGESLDSAVEAMESGGLFNDYMRIQAGEIRRVNAARGPETAIRMANRVLNPEGIHLFIRKGRLEMARVSRINFLGESVCLSVERHGRFANPLGGIRASVYDSDSGVLLASPRSEKKVGDGILRRRARKMAENTNSGWIRGVSSEQVMETGVHSDKEYKRMLRVISTLRRDSTLNSDPGAIMAELDRLGRYSLNEEGFRELCLLGETARAAADASGEGGVGWVEALEGNLREYTTPEHESLHPEDAAYARLLLGEIEAVKRDTARLLPTPDNIRREAQRMIATGQRPAPKNPAEAEALEKEVRGRLRGAYDGALAMRASNALGEESLRIKADTAGAASGLRGSILRNSADAPNPTMSEIERAYSAMEQQAVYGYLLEGARELADPRKGPREKLAYLDLMENVGEPAKNRAGAILRGEAEARQREASESPQADTLVRTGENAIDDAEVTFALDIMSRIRAAGIEDPQEVMDILRRYEGLEAAMGKGVRNEELVAGLRDGLSAIDPECEIGYRAKAAGARRLMREVGEATVASPLNQKTFWAVMDDFKRVYGPRLDRVEAMNLASGYASSSLSGRDILISLWDKATDTSLPTEYMLAAKRILEETGLGEMAHTLYSGGVAELEGKELTAEVKERLSHYITSENKSVLGSP